LPCKIRLIFDAIILVASPADSEVPPAKCGVKTKLSSFSNLSLGSAGSSQKTSKAAPAIILLTKDVKSPSLSTIWALATFIKNTELFIKLISFAHIKPLVSSVSGVWIEI
jgi:hypothetical protein